MKLLRRYLRGEIGRYTALGLLVFTFVLLMQEVGKLLEVTVRSNSTSLLAVFAYALPTALVFTLPMAVVVGTLVGLGRLGVDNELMALRAAGVSGWQMMRPLLAVGAAAMVCALVITLWLAPLTNRRIAGLQASLAQNELAAEVQPRVFLEPNPNWVVYVGDNLPGNRGWRRVFIADMHDPKTAPAIYMAAEGAAVNPAPGNLQVHLERGASYQINNQDPEKSSVTTFAAADLPFAVDAAKSTPGLAGLNGTELWWRARFAPDWRAARVEWYRRWALAVACLALAMMAIPLGLSGGRGGKSGGFVLTLVLVLAYYVIFIVGLGFAREGKVPPWLGAWAADLVFMAGGAWALCRVDRIPRDAFVGLDPVAWFRTAWARRIRSLHLRHPEGVRGRSWLPSLLDGYVVREFLGYTALLLASFLALVLIFTFFDLIGNILQNHIGAALVLQYLAYLSPQMLYQTIPVAILMAVLVTFGLMSKANEITALKASGISVYRLIVPVLLTALVLCGLQFTLDATALPGFNRKQDALRAQIKGQPAQSFRNPGRKWVFGQHNQIFYYTFFDPGRNEFADLSVLEFDPQRFVLTRRIFAREAHWDSLAPGWVFTNGWYRDLDQGAGSADNFATFQVRGFSEVSEKPAYFTTDIHQGSQMSYLELSNYIQALRSGGYDVARLSVQLAKKLAYPLITVIMALLAFPFALSVGRRGTITGVAIGIAVAFFYWVAAGLLEALGNLSQLPAMVAAWTPDLLFLVASVYLLLRIPT